MWRELRFACRRLWRAPGFVVAAVTVLALGIGVSTAVYAVVDPLLIRTLPGVVDPGSLVVLTSAGTVDTNDRWWPDAVDRFRSADDVFAGAFGFTGSSSRPVAIDDLTGSITINVATVTAEFFDVLGVVPGAGQIFSAGPAGDDERQVVLSHRFWKNQSNADPSVIGRSAVIDGAMGTIVGVAPPAFHGVIAGAEPDLYVLSPRADRARWMYVFARLRPGVSRERAQVALEPRFRAAVDASDIPIEERPQVLARLLIDRAGRGLSVARDRYGAVAWMLMGMVVLVSIVGCANVANLVLARATRHRHALTVRRALGATRARLLLHGLTEVVILAALGLAAGLVVAAWAGPRLGAALTAGGVDAGFVVTLDARVALFAIAAFFVSVVLTGLLPAWQAGRATTLALGARESPVQGAPWPRVTMLLVVAQIGLSTSSIAGATLMGRTLVNLLTRDVGFDASRVLAVTVVDARATPLPLGDRVLRLIGELRRDPGVETAAVATVTPIGGSIVGISVRADDDRDSRTAVHAWLTSAGPGYFETIGAPLTAGRDFAPGDVDGPPVAIVNETLAARLLGSGPVLGRRVRFAEGTRAPMTVVGVVADSAIASVRDASHAAIYTPVQLAGARITRATLLLRSRGADAADLAGQIERSVHTMDPDVSIIESRTLQSRISESVRGERVATLLLAGFSGTALGITAIGLFGVLAVSLESRTREIGLRLALGARRGDIAKLVIRPAAVMVGLGSILGVAGAFGVGRAFNSLLFGVGRADPATLVAVVLTLAVVMVVACLIPLRRALRVDPARLLRD